MKSFQDLVCPGHHKVTQGHPRVSKALGITYYLYWACRPKSSGKVEKANKFLKSAIKVITQETSLGCKEAFQYLSSAPVLPLRNRLVLVLMRCYMEGILFMPMTSS